MFQPCQKPFFFPELACFRRDSAIPFEPWTARSSQGVVFCDEILSPKTSTLGNDKTAKCGFLICPFSIKYKYPISLFFGYPIFKGPFAQGLHTLYTFGQDRGFFTIRVSLRATPWRGKYQKMFRAQ